MAKSEKLRRVTTWIRGKVAPRDQVRTTKFETLRVLAVMLIVFLALLAASWFTALWVTGIVGASMAYGIIRRAEQAGTETQPQA